MTTATPTSDQLDLAEMMQSMPLAECRREIESSIASLAAHPNKLKGVVIASFLLELSLDMLCDIDQASLLKPLHDNLVAMIEKGEQWRNKGNGWREHLEKNSEVLAAFESVNTDASRIASEIERLLASHDSIVRNLALERASKSIAEIEAEIAASSS